MSKWIWQLFQVNSERTEGYTLFFDTYEEALNAVNTNMDFSIDQIEYWDDDED